MIHKIVSVLTLVTALFVFSSSVLADDEVRKIEVDTKVKGFSQSEWKDNQESQDILFGPNNNLEMKVIVYNRGNRNQTNLKVKFAVPSSVKIDSPAEFTIPEIGAGSEYAKFITITVKDKAYVSKNITATTVRFDIKSEIGTQAGDFSTFYTNGGTKETVSTPVKKKILPATGAETLLLGTVSSLVAAFGALKLRKYSRGY